jgi:hypothetical protein
MLTKEKLLKTIKDLPEKFSFDDLMDRIILLHKIETGLEQSEKGELISEEDLDKKIKKWLE